MRHEKTLCIQHVQSVICFFDEHIAVRIDQEDIELTKMNNAPMSRDLVLPEWQHTVAHVNEHAPSHEFRQASTLHLRGQPRLKGWQTVRALLNWVRFMALAGHDAQRNSVLTLEFVADPCQ